jgi:hypothetical protein
MGRLGRVCGDIGRAVVDVAEEFWPVAARSDSISGIYPAIAENRTETQKQASLKHCLVVIF